MQHGLCSGDILIDSKSLSVSLLWDKIRHDGLTRFRNCESDLGEVLGGRDGNASVIERSITESRLHHKI
jgi:hypothetical protein